ARASCCSGPSARGSCRSSGRASSRPSSGSASSPAICCTPPVQRNPRRATETVATIEAHGLRKTYGSTLAPAGGDLPAEEGRILGLIGPNGAGKTTALNAILGLIPYAGELSVLGRDPWTARDELMRDVSFISDVAVLPRWMRVSQLLDYVEGVHPR